MRRTLLLVIPLMVLGCLAGWWLRGRVDPFGPREREVLYWVDPMNPSFRSTEPGEAPCGMPLEPVYDDTGGAAGSIVSNTGAGTIFVPADRRQLIGIVVATVERGPVEGTLRLPGRVAADESRVHVIAPKMLGRVGALGVAATGSLVHEGEFLASLTGDSASTAQWQMLQALRELDRVQRDDPDNAREIARLESTIRGSKQTLYNYGMSRELVEEIARKRQPSSNIEVHSPISGYVLSRTAVLGEEYHAYATLFVVANIQQVFVMADVLNEDVELVEPGAEATIRIPGRPHEFRAVVSAGPPQFDETFNGMKIRFAADNPDRVLLPGMFVDVQFPLRMTDALAVPTGAVIDSGLAERVYLDLGGGRFEPREVRTGWRLGGRVQILDGLVPGDAVVVSGNFLLDSESRMRSAGRAQ